MESGVGYVKKNFLRGLELPDGLDALNTAARQWVNAIANIRTHGETHKQPVELFAVEKQQLKPLPPIPPDTGITDTVRANNRFRIVLDTNHYSVPSLYASQRLVLKKFADRLYIYHDQKLIATHPRSYDRHRDFEDPDHAKDLLDQRRQARNAKLLLSFYALCPRAQEYHRQLQERRLNPRIHIAKIMGLSGELKSGRVNLDDPAVTLALLRQNAVVGLTDFFDPPSHLSSVGIQCALCHSTVDNAIAPGIGRRLDGWANRDLNVGTVVNLGKFDAELLLDGKGFRPDGKLAATLILPAFGLAGVNLHTWTGWGSVTHWNAFVANIEMHGKGTFFDSRLSNTDQFPVAARAGFGSVRNTPDLITAKLPALHFYQLALPAPSPPQGSFDQNAALRGKRVFIDRAKCASRHVPPIYTEPGWNMHSPIDIGIDDFQANRAPDKKYRTSPLKGLWTHTKGGFYHDGRFANLLDVVNHYDTTFGLTLTPQEKADLVEYLKSL